MMKIGVLVKTVKFVYAQTGTDIQTNYVGPDDIVHMLNPLDEIALEYALQLKDQDPATQVIAVSCGDHTAEDGLRRSLAMGADRAVHVPCEDRGGLDPIAISKLLGLACERERFDLILCGATAIDVNEGLEGPYVAERLAIPYASNIVHIAAGSDGRRLNVQRVVERSDRQLLECRLPVLLTVEKGTATPRYPTLAGFLRSREVPLEVVEQNELGVSRPRDLTELKQTELFGYTRPKPKRRRDSALQSRLPAAARVSFMVNGDASREKSGGRIVKAGSEEIFGKLDEMLRAAGVLKD
jgi:electron transfer flavoprotein beta subunit